MSESPWIIEVDESTFQQEVLVKSQTVPVVVDFWAEWCQPCRLLAPLLHAQAEKRAGAMILAKVNIEACQRIASYFRIESIPTVLVFRNAEVVNGFEGMLSETEIDTFLNEVAPMIDGADPKAVEAEVLPSDPIEIEARFRAKIATNADDHRSRLDLVKLLIAQRRDAEVEEMLSPIPPGGDIGAEVEKYRAMIAIRALAQSMISQAEFEAQVVADPEDGEASYGLGIRLAEAEKYPEALTMLLKSAEVDKVLARGKVREAMLSIFRIIGVRSDLADSSRDQLQRLLY